MRLTAALVQVDTENSARLILVNNAGTLGDLTRIDCLPSLASLRTAIDLNVTSASWTTARFLRLLRARAEQSEHVPSEGAPDLVLNISSLAAVQAFPTMGVYCAGKAARDVVHAAAAMELSDFSTRVRAPGSAACGSADMARCR